MSIQMVLLPVFVSVGLTFALLLWKGSARGQVGGETGSANHFELLLLFYVLIALALITQHASAPLAGLAWLFVISRVVHAFIHSTSNDVPRRFWAYCFGMTVLIIMWLWFAVSVIA